MPVPEKSEARLVGTRLSPTRCLLTVVGALDYYSAPEMSHDFHQYIDDGLTDYILELDGATHIDSSGLGFVISVYHSVRARDSHLVVVVSNTRYLNLLSKTRLDQVLTIVSTRAAALVV
ncbi:MAG TPA: STAS domain-containing protein [Candidatus Xenobia bacterium]